MTCRATLIAGIWCLVVALLFSHALAADWPTYKMDAQRSGVTAETLDFPLAQKWTYHTAQPPMPAWPEPGKELHRMDFDYAFQPVAAGGLIYIASSADDTLRALDATTGALVWRFTAGGPIRFAPTIANRRAYVASDDGWFYCLDARTGALTWRFHAAPGDDQVIGNGRMISRWPCRTGALVVDDVVYCTAGMWPTEGVYIYALDAGSGRELWCNDSSGSIYIDLPHPGATGFSGVAPQGYLLVRGGALLVPTGRCVPAAYDRHTGRLLYYKPADALYHGAAWITSTDGLYFNAKNRFQNPSQAHIGEADPVSGDGMYAYSFATGDVEFTLAGKYRVLASEDTLYAVGEEEIQAIDVASVRRTKGVRSDSIRWTVSHSARVYCLAMAGETLLAGSRSSIAALNSRDGKAIWDANVDGQVRGLAVSDGRLIASTHDGSLVCFGPSGAGNVASTPVRETVSLTAVPAAEKRIAARIIEQSGKPQGHAMVIGERDSRLAEALAAETDLRIVSVLLGADEVGAERQRLLGAGLLGSRVAVQGVADLDQLPFAPYFADLVVVSGEVEGVSPEECYRVLRPCGGALCFVGIGEAQREAFVRQADVPPEEFSRARGTIVRAGLPDAGEWRYPWADGGRTGVGKDRRVRLPLQMLWFGGPGPDRLMDRHFMTSPPVSANGRVFMTGEHHVIAFDAYNGRELWSRHIPDVGRRYAQYYSSGLVADDTTVYAVQGDRCHRLDQATGEIVSVYDIPQSVIRDTPPPVVPEYVHVDWPDVWHVVGPFPTGKSPLPPETLTTIPDRVTVDGQEHVATPTEAVNGLIDFTNLYGGFGLQPLAPGELPGASPRKASKPDLTQAGQVAYALATIDCPRPGTLLIGAGADWWMQWYLDGMPIFDTLNGGNEPPRHNLYSASPCSATDYIFDVDVTPGRHVLAVMVKAGSAGWSLASASMAQDADTVFPVVSDDVNLPDLSSLVWGYLSVADDLLLGSYTVPIAAGQSGDSHLIWRSESKAVFALNKSDGSLRWVYRPRPDRTVSNIEIAHGDGKLFLLDATSKADSAMAKRRGQEPDIALTLVALDLARGTRLWQQDDVPALPDRSMQTRIKSNPTHLLMGLPNWGHLVYANGVVVLGANAAWDGATGDVLWNKDVRPQKLPIVVGDWLIGHPYAYDLATGQQRMSTDILTGAEVPWRYERAYGCGPVNGCENLLFFRSGADGFFDMNVGGTTNFGGVRSNCGRSLIAANGLLIHPEGHSGCGCSYNYQTCLALVPTTDRNDAWYVLPRGVTTGPIKRVAVNFGAPGDQRDSAGAAWLGFPRPMMANACPAPVTVLMDDASCYSRRRATASIKGTDAPWVYSSGLRGRGRIAIDLVLQPDILMPTLEAAPTIDGRLDDLAWPEAQSVPFENTPFSILGASVDLRVFRDAENLYFGYQRKPLSNPRADAGAAALADSDGFQIYITDAAKRGGIHLAIGRSGEASGTFGTVDRYRKTDPRWNGVWRHGVQQTPEEWTTEVAVPLATLTDSGIDLGRLQLNCMSQNLTGSGLESIFLVDPRYGADFHRCIQFLGVADSPPRPARPRSFTVRLHFSELDDVEVGRRVFDVALQGETVLRDLDIAREAGGRHTALVKEFAGVEGGDRIVIQLSPKADAGADPVISGVEIVEEA